jgi:hypothetical protein
MLICMCGVSTQMLDEGLAASVKLLEQVTIDADEKNDRPRVRCMFFSFLCILLFLTFF